MSQVNTPTNPQPDRYEIDDKLALFFDKAIIQETVDTSVEKGINLDEVRWFT